jgi:hypothetical protein
MVSSLNSSTPRGRGNGKTLGDQISEVPPRALCANLKIPGNQLNISERKLDLRQKEIRRDTITSPPPHMHRSHLRGQRTHDALRQGG